MEEKERKAAAASEAAKAPAAQAADTTSNTWRKKEDKRKLSFKEKREMEELEKKIEELTAERTKLESDLSSGTLDNDAIVAAGNRIGEVISQLDEAELRYLELLEIEG